MADRAAHEPSCRCVFCEKLTDKTRTVEDWNAEHAPHGGFSRQPFPHPSGDWFWQVCPCGAKHLRMEASDG